MSTCANADGPLQGVLVLDFVEGPLAPLCRLYADLGAQVVRVRTPDSQALRNRREGLAERIGEFGKIVRILDPARQADSAALEALVRSAHMVVRGGDAPGSPYDPLIDAVAAERPEVVLMEVSMFGRGHAWAGWQATDAVLHALSGGLCRSGLSGREPLLPPGELAVRCALTQMGVAGLAALHHALVTGEGDRLDASALDGAVQALDPGFGMGGTAATGQPASDLPPGRPGKGIRYPIFACADGHVRICLLAPRQWQGMFRWMGEPAAFAGPRFDDMNVRFGATDLTAAIAAFFSARTRGELEREGQAFGVPIAALRSLEECVSADHLTSRGAFVDLPLGDGPQAPAPNGVIEIDGVRMGPREGPVDSAAAPLQWGAAPAAGPLPLSGLKVLDLGVIVVGAEQARLLADLGADVVKVESRQFPDGARQTSLPTGVSISVAAGHRNKRSLGLNLRSPEGKALFLRLAAQADVVLSNFKPCVLESLGLGHDVLAALNPRLISVESSAFGADGPWGDRMGYGPLVRATAGVTNAWRYPDDPESFSDSLTVYPDHAAARIGAAAALALLIRRLRTGCGGQARIAQLEVMLDHFAGDIAARALDDPGLDDPPDAPWGVFRTAGDDDWCVVTVRCDRDWLALGPLIGCEAPELRTRAGRLAARDQVETALQSWLSKRSAQAAMEVLQAAGVPAGRMLRVGDLPGFGYFQARRLFRTERHPHLADEILAERFLVEAERLAPPPSRPAPVMGAHTAEVMRDWLGLGAAEIAELIEAGALEPTPAEMAKALAATRG